MFIDGKILNDNKMEFEAHRESCIYWASRSEPYASDVNQDCSVYMYNIYQLSVILYISIIPSPFEGRRKGLVHTVCVCSVILRILGYRILSYTSSPLI